MNLTDATHELEKYLPKNYPEFKGTIEWEVLGKSFWVARLRIPRGMVIATYNPLRGVTVFDSVSELRKSGGIWKEFR